jgi:hypothetical protein
MIDAPTLSIALARTLAAKADAVVIVASWRCRPEDGLEVALRMPPFDRSANVGVVLNRVVVPRHLGRRFATILDFGGKPDTRYA